MGKHRQVKTTKLQPFCRASPIFWGQVSNHNKYKLQNYNEFFTNIKIFWTSNQVTIKNYKTTGNFSCKVKTFLGKSGSNNQKLQNYRQFFVQSQKNFWASKQATSKNYKTTAVLSRKSNFFGASKQSQQVQTKKLQSIFHTYPKILGK